jgi:hypothetical protein
MLKPIFITGAHKSGTSLLRSLLDGHGNLFVLPFETHFLANCGLEPLYPLRNACQVAFIRNSNFIERTKKVVYEYIDNNSKFTDSNQFNINIDLLDKTLSGINLQLGTGELYHSFCEAVYQSIYQDELKDKRVVEKSVENAEMAWVYQNLFPDSYFIHIIRNPYANLVSLRKFKTNNKTFPSLIELLLSLYINYKYLELNQRIIRNYYLIKYEDLIEDPETSMKNLSDFLGIEYEPTLLQTTSLDQPWESNSVYGSQSPGITTSKMLKWKDVIEPLEIYYINKMFRDYMIKYHYETIKSGSFLKPAKHERFKTYIRNRFFKLYLNNFA